MHRNCMCNYTYNFLRCVPGSQPKKKFFLFFFNKQNKFQNEEDYFLQLIYSSKFLFNNSEALFTYCKLRNWTFSRSKFELRNRKIELRRMKSF